MFATLTKGLVITMISRPNFLVFSAAMTGLLLMVALVVSPSPAYIWRSIDPVGYAGNRVTTATRFLGPGESDTGILEAPLDSWRVLARSPVADSAFHALATSSARVPRLYGIAGVALSDSVTAGVLASQMMADTTTVSARLHPCDMDEGRRARELADSVRLPHFARFLLSGDAAACRHPRNGA